MTTRRGVLGGLAALGFATRAQAATPLQLLAAASLKPVLVPILSGFTAKTGVAVSVQAGPSSQLAKQIAQGLPCDLFLSADQDWMVWVAARGLLSASKPRLIAHNRLVIASADQSLKPTTTARLRSDLQMLLKSGLMAVAETQNVPLGRYTKAAFTHLKCWDVVQPRTLIAQDARAATNYVRLGEAKLGALYRTDALSVGSLKTLYLFPPESHPRIDYPGAVPKAAANPKGAQSLLDYLKGPEAQAHWRRFGFDLPA